MATRDTRRIVEVPSDRFEAPIRNDRLASAVVDQKDLKIESRFFGKHHGRDYYLK
jgi:hypothetical protein